MEDNNEYSGDFDSFEKDLNALSIKMNNNRNQTSEHTVDSDKGPETDDSNKNDERNKPDKVRKSLRKSKSADPSPPDVPEYNVMPRQITATDGFIEQVKAGDIDCITQELKKAHRRMSTPISAHREEELIKLRESFSAHTGQANSDAPTYEPRPATPTIGQLTIYNMTAEDLELQSQYITKLETELQNEAISRKKMLMYMRSNEKNANNWKLKYEEITEKLLIKDNTINHLYDTIRSLEIQLSLMDDKCIELRTKLTNARNSNNNTTHIKKKSNKHKKSNNHNHSSVDENHLFSDFGHSSSEVTFPPVGGTTGSRSGMSSGEYSDTGGNTTFAPIHDNIYLSRSTSSTSTTHKKAHYSTSGNSHRYSSGKADDGITLEHVEEKLNKSQGLKKQWTREKLEELTVR